MSTHPASIARVHARGYVVIRSVTTLCCASIDRGGQLPGGVYRYRQYAPQHSASRRKLGFD